MNIKKENCRIFGFVPTVAISLFIMAMFMQSCDDEMKTGQPSWLGNSIYERLQEYGNYSYTLRLIDDLDQTSVLSQTGSKTVFVADDASFEEWFANNSWGVHSYDQLTSAQKNMLFNASMINNAYLIELMSNVQGSPPEKGLCMRRATAASIYDSVYTMLPSEMPNTTAWDKHRNKSKGILIFKDNSTAPMIHFLPAYMSLNKITDEDLTILTNGEAQSVSEAWINGKKVTERDITCKNGYIHKVEAVVEPLSNIAEILRQHSDLSLWSHLIDRYSAPFYDASGTENYRRLYNTEDSVFTLKYYSEKCYDHDAVTTDDDGNVASAQLLFDPGYNQFMYNNTMGYDMHYDAGGIIAPSNEVLQEWWDNGGGYALKEMYGDWDNIPDGVLVKMLNVNMIENFSDKVPSKFKNILNDSKVSLGITTDNVDSCFIGCNGVVYMVDKVFTPSAYSSVSFPALTRMESNMQVIYRGAIDELEYDPYLNSMDSYYSLFLPTDDALLWYVDPVAYGENQQYAIRFEWDATSQSMKAAEYRCQLNSDGTITVENSPVLASMTTTSIENRLRDLMEQLIIVGNVEDGYEYYKSKGGTYLKVKNAGQENAMTIQGGWQMERDQEVTVGSIYDMSVSGNGKSYELPQIDGADANSSTAKVCVPLGATKSVYNVLGEHSEYKQFLDLLQGGDPDASKQNLLVNTTGSSTVYRCGNYYGGNYNMRLFENYNYTVYVPTSESLQSLIDQYLLPTWDVFDQLYELYSEDNDEEARAACDTISAIITEFLRYHIQDNSVIIGGAPTSDTQGNLILSPSYETMMQNPENSLFYTVSLDLSGDNITITDQQGNKRQVVKTRGLYNNICREYWLSGVNTSASVNNRQIYMSSDAVVHLIDGPLMYKENQLSDWRKLIPTRLLNKLTY